MIPLIIIYSFHIFVVFIFRLYSWWNIWSNLLWWKFSPMIEQELLEKYHSLDQMKSVFTSILIYYNEAHTQENYSESWSFEIEFWQSLIFQKGFSLLWDYFVEKIVFYVPYFSILCHLKLLWSKDQNPAVEVALCSGGNSYVFQL